jgi:hypothetical protein
LVAGLSLRSSNMLVISLIARLVGIRTTTKAKVVSRGLVDTIQSMCLLVSI